MFGLSQLIKTAGTIAWKFPTSNKHRWLQSRRRPVQRVNLTVETLEERTVPTLLGQDLFPADYPWNQNIASAPVAANSGAIIANIGTNIGIHADWGEHNAANGTDPLYGIPINIVHGNTAATVNFVIDAYPDESDLVPVPMPANPIIEGDFQNGPNLAGPGDGRRGDSHLIIWDQDNNIAYELFGASRPNDQVTMEGDPTGGLWHAAQLSVWDMSENSFRPLSYTSADAAGLSILAGLVRPDEGLPTALGGQGEINHALRFTLPASKINPQYMYPASHMVFTNSGASNLPMGGRLRLKNTQAVNDTIANLGPQAQIIAHAMQQYGLVLSDIGSSMYVTGTSRARDANNNLTLVWDMDDVLDLSAIKSGDFEVVDLRPRVTGLSANGAAPGSTLTIFGQNFSGAAGRLSVFFGSTAATNVTYVSDTQITATVPFGAGTVHVSVQSGINETDPNNPNRNVTNPIWGYGTSATTTADSFTFGPSQTISATNTTASFATPTVASGLGDVLTIAVQDTSGNPVGGIPSNVFNFAFSGGTSTGTFSPVTATATQGTYTTTFTGVLAGTVNTLTITIAGVTIAIQPTITVTPGAISGTASTLSFASPTVAVGGGVPLTIGVKDAAGNIVSGLASTAFGFSLSGGTSAGTFGAVSETATPGTYTTTFTAVTPGTAAALNATVSGINLAAHPTIAVTSSTTFSDNFATAGANQQLNSSWTKQVGSFQVNTSARTATGLATLNLATVNGINNANESVSAVVTVPVGRAAGLVARHAGTGDRNMYMGVVSAVAGGYNASIYRNSNGTWTQLYAKSYTGALTNALLQFDVIGSSLRLHVNGAIVAFASDTMLSAAGRVGMRTGAGVVVKNFNAGPLSLQNSASPTTFSDNFATAGANQQLTNFWFNQAGNFKVTTASQTAVGLGSLNLATVNGFNSADTSVSATVTVSGTQLAGLAARHSGPGDRNMYFAAVKAGAGVYTAYLYRNVNGVYTNLFMKTYTGAVTNAVLQFDVVGTSLRLFLNGNIIAYANDTAITGAGSVGVRSTAGAVMKSFAAAPLTLANQSIPYSANFNSAGANGQLNNHWLNRTGNIRVAGGAALGVGGVNLATANGISAANVTAQADISLTATGQFAGLVARYAGNGDQNMYFAGIFQTGANTYLATLYVNTAGTWRLLKSQAVSAGSGTLRLTVNGTNLAVTYRGATLFNVNDATISAAGAVGVRLSAGATADNFSVT